jgi:glyoxylase-like metal-dependent hydrolase (beta-lactamase superfamily II)
VQTWQVGDVKVTQIVELVFTGLDAFLPDATPEAVLPIEWLRPHFITPEGILRFSIHALVIDTGARKIIVDTCVGNDKPRDVFPDWHMLQTGFLEDLASAGYPRESIDTVLCTHLHLDHVGWNTMLEGGQWVPTFPNARYLLERSEFAYVAQEAEAEDVEPWLRDMNRAVMADSIRPVVDAGLIDLVDADHRLCEEVRLMPTPGHTIGHVSVHIASRGESALITGDFIHHPCQLAHPEWSVTTDYDPSDSVSTRERVFAELADGPTLVIGTHWPEPTAGKIASWGDTYQLKTDP